MARRADDSSLVWRARHGGGAEPRFRRVRGYRDLRYLVAALDALAPPDGAGC